MQKKQEDKWSNCPFHQMMCSIFCTPLAFQLVLSFRLGSIFIPQLFMTFGAVFRCSNSNLAQYLRINIFCSVWGAEPEFFVLFFILGHRKLAVQRKSAIVSFPLLCRFAFFWVSGTPLSLRRVILFANLTHMCSTTLYLPVTFKQRWALPSVTCRGQQWLPFLKWCIQNKPAIHWEARKCFALLL